MVLYFSIYDVLLSLRLAVITSNKKRKSDNVYFIKILIAVEL